MPKHAMKGVPDIILIKEGGQFVGLEVKRPGGAASPEQLDFQRHAKERGAAYHIVRSIDDVQSLGL
jgi:hypothetical protein